MHVIGTEKLKKFMRGRPDAEARLRAWYSEAKDAEWKSPVHVKRRYGSASILGNNRVVFNISGNKYRLVVQIDYQNGIVQIRFVGTHAEYDGVDAEVI